MFYWEERWLAWGEVTPFQAWLDTLSETLPVYVHLCEGKYFIYIYKGEVANTKIELPR